jgi:hypothetical protein
VNQEVRRLEEIVQINNSVQEEYLEALVAQHCLELGKAAPRT